MPKCIMTSEYIFTLRQTSLQACKEILGHLFFGKFAIEYLSAIKIIRCTRNPLTLSYSIAAIASIITDRFPHFLQVLSVWWKDLMINLRFTMFCLVLSALLHSNRKKQCILPWKIRRTFYYINGCLWNASAMSAYSIMVQEYSAWRNKKEHVIHLEKQQCLRIWMNRFFK